MRVIFISDSRLCGVERMRLGSSSSVVNTINYYCVPGLQLDRVKQYINSERFEKLQTPLCCCILERRSE